MELGKVCEFLRGINVSSKNQFLENINGKLSPFIRIGDLQSALIDTSKMSWIEPIDNSTKNNFIVYPEEILMAMVGATAGKTSANNLGQKGYFSSNICKIGSLPVSIVNQRYLFYVLQIKKDRICQSMSLGAKPSLKLSELKKLQIPLPSLEKQEKIANWLDKFRELTNDISKGLPKEILLLKQQSKYYREKLIS